MEGCSFNASLFFVLLIFAETSFNPATDSFCQNLHESFLQIIDIFYEGVSDFIHFF